MARRGASVAAALLVLLAGAAGAQTPERHELRQEVQRAEALEQAGRLDEAEAVYRNVLDGWPVEPGALLGLERVLRRRGALDGLVPLVERGVAADPGSTLLRQMQLRTLAELGRLDELRRAGSAWLEADPRSETAPREYAGLLRRLGDAPEAERVLRAALPRVSRPEPVLVELADLYLSQLRWQEAVESWLSLMRASPGAGWDIIRYKLESLGEGAGPVAEATMRLGEAGDTTGAAARLGTLVALYSDNPEVARAQAQRVLAGGPALPDQRAFMTQVARTAADRGHEGVAAWAYSFLLGAGGDGAPRMDLTRRVVEHELAVGDTVAALQRLERAMTDVGAGAAERRWAAATRVKVLAAGSGAGEAEEAFRDFVAKHGGESEEAVALAALVAEAELREGRLEEAARILDGVTPSRTDPRASARVALVRGYIDLHRGNYDGARRELESAALAVDGERRNEVIRLLRFLRDGNAEELSAVARAQRSLARGLAGTAYDELRQGLDAASASAARPGLLLWAGELALAADRLADAEAELQRLARDYPAAGEAPVGLMKLAEALAENGRRQEAIELLERLIIDYPSSALTPLARRRLAELRQEVPSL